MVFNDMKYNLSEWIKLNLEFAKRVKKNYHFKKNEKIDFDSRLINDLLKSYSPVFVLSTGRCGTEYLTKILELSMQTDVYHSQHPELIFASKYAYENYNANQEIIKKIVESARIELILESFLRKRIFVETNNKITFFAFAISELFPNSKFIHLVRHPGNFVRSGIRRNWYKNSSKHDLGRIVPHDGQLDFTKYNDIQKISWLWNETNLFIENFKVQIRNTNRVMTIKAEDLFGNRNTINSVYDFIGCEYPTVPKIKKALNKKINVQHKEDFPRFHEWNKNDRELLANICTIADKYSYELINK